MADRIQDSDGSPNSTNQVIEGVWQRLRSEISLPDRKAIETLATGVTVTFPKGSWESSIANAKVVSEFPDVSKSITLLGTNREGMVNFYGSGSYAPNWKSDINDGTVGQVNHETSSFGTEFWVSGDQLLELSCGKFTADAYVKIWIDGRPTSDFPIKPDWTNQTGNAIKIDLGDSQPHKVKLWLDRCSLGKIWTGPTGTIWPTVPRPTRLFVLGDSLTAGSPENAGGELGTWLPRFASYLGIDDYWNGSIFGTGPIGFNNYVNRAATDVVPSDADMIFIGSWNNSRTEPIPSILTAYASILDILETMPNRPEIILFGSPDPSGVGSAPYSTVDSALRTFAEQYSIPYISPLTGAVYDEDGVKVYDSGPWITESNRLGIVGTDGTHPDDIGQKWLALRMLESYLALVL